MITYKYKNHAVRSEQWRYIRYENGDEELYHNAVDPYEWTNLATMAQYDPIKAELAKWLPKTDAPWPQQAMDKSSRAAKKGRQEGTKPGESDRRPVNVNLRPGWHALTTRSGG